MSIYIKQQQELVELSAQLATYSWLALDTEFQRESTYYPQLCLLQVATPDLVACIDPFAVEDLQPFLEVLFRNDIIKVFHACSQDLEIFYHQWQKIPAPIFDTQVAAPLLGFPEQIGYANLVEKVLGQTLNKSQTRTDWSKRPLSKQQIQYAEDDVRFLVKLYEAMHQSLENQNRLQWLQADFAALSKVSKYKTEPDKMWLKVKGVQRLKGKTLAIVQALAAWRETSAQKADVPRNRILRDEALIDLARLDPHSREELADLRSISAGTQRRHGDDLLALLKTARQQTADAFPKFLKTKSLSPEQENLVDLLTTVVSLQATKENLNPNSILTRKKLGLLVTGTPLTELISGWQYQLVSEVLEKVLAGDLALAVNNRAVTLTTRTSAND